MAETASKHSEKPRPSFVREKRLSAFEFTLIADRIATTYDPFDVLGIFPNASPFDIQTAYVRSLQAISPKNIPDSYNFVHQRLKAKVISAYRSLIRGKNPYDNVKIMARDILEELKEKLRNSGMEINDRNLIMSACAMVSIVGSTQTAWHDFGSDFTSHLRTVLIAYENGPEGLPDSSELVERLTEAAAYLHIHGINSRKERWMFSRMYSLESFCNQNDIYS